MSDFLDHLNDPEQGTDGWHDERSGKFTSSQIHRLMTPVLVKRNMTPAELAARPKTGEGSRTGWIEEEDHNLLSSGAITYIRELIAEEMTGRSDQAGSFATAHGLNMEVEAKAYFTEITGYEITPLNFINFSTIAGGSPDGDVPGLEAIFELKSPYNPRIQLEYFLDLDGPAKLKILHPDYYWQIMANCLWTKRKRSVFVTYDPDQIETLKMRFLMIDANPEDQKAMLNKIAVAQKEKDRITEQLKNVTQQIPIKHGYQRGNRA